MARRSLLLGLALAAAACDRGEVTCGPGFYPRGGECVAFAPDAMGMPRPDAGTRDSGPIYADAGDAGTFEPIDGSVYDSGYEPPPPVVTLGERGRILLHGEAVLTMAGANVIAPGEVYISGDRIGCVGARGACAAMAVGASVVETHGVILPGLVDSHNHLAYNWLPEWTPGRLFGDHDQWQSNSEYHAFTDPYRMNSGDAAKFCAMAQWGELRSLVNGTTTMYGAVATRACLRWLVRNAELPETYNGLGVDRIRSNVLGIGTLNETEAADLRADMDSGLVAAYMIHIAEGISTRAYNEYTELVRLGLLRRETVIIHGTALMPADFTAVAASGAKLVWSPSSNMALYGQTTDVSSAINAGVPVSISPDWTPSGADTILAELRFAKSYLASADPDLFTDRELLEAATRVAAENMSVGQHIGTLEPGKLADILVVAADDATPYDSVIAARSQHIRLVMIGGVPSYGDPAIVGALRETPPSCFDLPACNTVRRACWEDPSSGGPVSPESIAAVIRGFYPDGPLDLFDCE